MCLENTCPYLRAFLNNQQLHQSSSSTITPNLLHDCRSHHTSLLFYYQPTHHNITLHYQRHITIFLPLFFNDHTRILPFYDQRSHRYLPFHNQRLYHNQRSIIFFSIINDHNLPFHYPPSHYCLSFQNQRSQHHFPFTINDHTTIFHFTINYIVSHHNSDKHKTTAKSASRDIINMYAAHNTTFGKRSRVAREYNNEEISTQNVITKAMKAAGIPRV